MRRGYTLTELLVVITLMVIVLAVSVPMAKYVMDGSHAREASRQLQAYFSMAQTRAVQTRKPCGVQFIVNEALGSPGIYQATTCYLAQSPPNWSGTHLASRGIFRIEPPGRPEFVLLVTASDLESADANMDGRWDEDQSEMLFLRSLLDPFEVFEVQFSHAGLWYEARMESGRFVMVDGSIVPLPVDFNNQQSGGHPFTIRRSPRRIGSPLELPPGTTLDLPYSGIGRTGQQFAAATRSLTVMFQPDGTSHEYYVNATRQHALGTMHLLVGEVDKLASPIGGDWNDPALSNIADTKAIWVSVGRTGVVTTAENLPDRSSGIISDLIESGRSAATERWQMHGR